MAVAEVALLPIVDRPKTRPDGSPFTADDKEFWELANHPQGGIRRYVYQEYPRMLYRGVKNDAGKVVLTQCTVGRARDEGELDPSWKREQQAALDHVEGLGRDIARAAAEAAFKAESMTDKAKREYKQRSANSPTHVTE